MEAAIFVYIASILEPLAGFLLNAGIVGLVLAFFVLFWRFLEQVKTKLNAYFWILCGCSVLSIFMSNLLPTQKTMYIMGGAYLGQKAIQTETAGKIVTIINKKLDDYLEESAK